MEQREAVLWAALTMLFIGIVAGVFVRTDHPISGNAVRAQSCGTLQQDTVLECQATCAQIGRCDTYKVSCASRTFSCTCATC